jgi:hypothetical protein
MVANSELSSFGEKNFGTAELGHKTREACLVKLANLLQRHPGGTLPDKLAEPKDYKAMMRLVNRPEVTHAAVLQPHRQRTFRLMNEVQGAVVLLVHDQTVLDYSSLKSLAKDLGPVGNGHGRGYLCHNSLAVDPQNRQVLGLANQILHRCDQVHEKESLPAKRMREGRESRLWTTAVRQIGPVAPDKLVVDVCDRGADVFEFLAWEVKHHRHFVVRSKSNRSLVVEGPDAKPAYLHDYARTLPAMGEKTITVHGRDGALDRKAQVQVSAAVVTVKPPHETCGEYEKKPLTLWVVRVWEEHPPADKEAVEWLLLTSEPAGQRQAAWEVASWYECRWLVEEFHKAQKTGCNVEDVQFTTVAALQPTIALLSVVATTLLNLRSLSRQPEAKTLPATSVVDTDYVEVLSRWRYKEKRELTIYEFFFALARLGGHQNRKGDGHPGWLVLWRGWMKLQFMQTGYEIHGQT